MMTISQLKLFVEELAQKFDITPDHYYLPTFGYSQDGARPAIFVNQKGFHYVIVERGEVLREETSTDIHELLYWVFESITFALARDYELKHREMDKDSRRLLFSEQERLIGLIHVNYQERLVRKHQEILALHPFHD